MNFKTSSTSLSLFLQCYYIGGKEESAVGILGDLSWPVKSLMPADVVCSKLNKKDPQLCSLRYGESHCSDLLPSLYSDSSCTVSGGQINCFCLKTMMYIS